jgi:hypothetical protein
MVRNHLTSKKLQSAAIGAMLASIVASMPAQSRMAVRIKSPLSPGRIGTSTSVGRFNQYSYGAGSLSSSPTGSGGDVLRSSIRRSSRSSGSLNQSSGSLLRSDVSSAARSYRVSRPSGRGLGIPALPNVGSVETQGTRLYTPSRPGAVVGSAPGVGNYLQRTQPAAMLAAQDYLDLMSNASAGALDSEHSGTIPSLVPDEEGPYRDHMQAGEDAFHTGDYAEALKEFRLASHLRPHDPEPMIHMLHARFAVSGYSYSLVAFHLKQALAKLPELPLVELDPKSFYGEARDYASQMSRLRGYLADVPNDVEALLVEAYYQWFAGETDDSRRALTKAFEAAKRAGDEEALEAISTFWTGMVASGRVSGELGTDAPGRATGP